MIRIVKAEEKHLPELMVLWKENNDYHTGIEPYVVARADAVQLGERHLKELVQAPDTLILVALDNGHLIGFSVSRVVKNNPIWQHEKFGFIDDVCVTASYRRRGVGEKLLGEIEKWFKSKKISRLELTVYAANSIGNSFWRKQGFIDFTYRLRKEIPFKGVDKK
jgi:ribosomal protein S18 acetylase RimI-like enzyme